MRITNLANIRDAVASMTWAITPQKLDAIIEVLELRAGSMSVDEIQERLAVAAPRTQQRAGAVAVIPLAGTLYPKANMFTSASGGVSVDQFVAQVEAAIGDPNVSAVVIDVDSPGGAAAGVPEAAARLRALRGKGKPIVAVANTLMASGAYWLASQADSIVASPSADVGSVGVFTVHRDLSKAYEDAGVKHTLIKAGKYKAEGVPFEPLSEDARAALQEKVDDTYAEFLSAVARGRGVSVATARSDFGQGRVLSAMAAKKAGMVDAIGTLQAVVSDLAAGRTAKYLRASDDTLPLLAEGVASDVHVVDFSESADALRAIIETSATTASAGLSLVSTSSSDLAPPVAEEHSVDNTTTATPVAAAEPTREQQLHELAALTGNADKYFEWVGSTKSVAQIRGEILNQQANPTATSASARVIVGAQRETQKPWASFGEQLQAVMTAGNPNVREFDPRLFAAASGMSQGVPAEGGFLVAPEFSTAIWEGMSGAPDALLPLTDNYTVTGESLTFNADAETSRATGSRRGGVQGYWMAEAAQYTGSKPKFRQVRIEPNDLGVFVYLTDKLMANSSVALQQYVSRCAADEINTLVTESIINGTGSGQPKGILTGTYSSGVSTRVRVSKESSQAADTINQFNISKMWARMHPKLRANAVWLHNVDAEPALDTLSTVVQNVAGTENVGGYANKVFDAERRTLKGRPLIACESCPTLGDEGDLILWAPQAYLTGTKGGVKEAMSMHIRFDYNETAFRFLFSVDGQPWHTTPVTPLKGSNILSSIVTLEAR